MEMPKTCGIRRPARQNAIQMFNILCINQFAANSMPETIATGLQKTRTKNYSTKIQKMRIFVLK